MRATILKVTILLSVFALNLHAHSSDNNEQDSLSHALEGLGGADVIRQLEGYKIESERDEYIMGQSPEPGKGMFRISAPIFRASHDLKQGFVRIGLINLVAAREGGYFENEIKTLLLGQEGYVSENDIMGIVKERDKPLSSDKSAAAMRTERLLNPHILIKEALQDSSLVLDLKLTANLNKGWRYKEDEVLPVTIDRVRQTGKRTLIASKEWERQASKKTFYPLMINKILDDPDWFNRWQKNTDIDESDYIQLTIKNEVYPITFFINPQTSKIDKLKTMEWDVIYGDITLEVTFDDWQIYSGVFFPRTVRMSQGGAPRLEITRKTIEVNPDYSLDHFSPPDSVAYVHDENSAQRGKTLSQTLRMFTLSGASRPKLDALKLDDGVYLLSAKPLDGIYTMVVEQSDGLVVVEPGMNDLKGEEVIKWAMNKFPDKPITHLIATHFHNDHGGGIRPYIAAGAALVVHESAKEFYSMQINRPKSSVVIDALDRKFKKGSEQIIKVTPDQGYTIEDTLQPMTIYPILNGHTEDMVIAVIDNKKMLYAGDLYVSGIARDKRSGTKRGPDVLPYHSATSLNDAIIKFAIPIESLVGSHDKEPVSYKDLIDYITD